MIFWEADPSYYGTEGLEDSLPWVLRKFANDAVVVEGAEDIDMIDASQKYFSSFYWSLTTLVKTPWIGPGPIPEKVLASVLVVAGAIIFAIILAQKS